MSKLEVKELLIEQVIPYWRNPRHNELAIIPVMESIKRYGYCQPIVVDKNNVIITGHTRYKALLQLDVKKVEVIVLQDISQLDAKKYRIIDNKINEFSRWDSDKLIEELKEFENIENFQIYFKDQDVIDLISKNVDAITTEAKVDEIFPVKTLDPNIELVCPECGESFFINRKEILTKGN